VLRAAEGMEAEEETSSGTNDVVVLISAGKEEGLEKLKQGGDSQSLETFEPEYTMQSLASPSSLEVKKLDPAENKVLDKLVTRRRSLARSCSYLKPASRLVEPPRVSSSPKSDDPPNMASYSPTGRVNASSTPSDNASPGPTSPSRRRAEASDEEEVILHKDKILRVQMKGMMLVLELVAFVCIVGFLIASLVFDRLKHRMILSLQIWKWCVLVVLCLCGRLITGRLTDFLAFLVRKRILPYQNVLFFAFSVSARIFIWLGLVLLAWGLLIYRGVDRPKETTRILDYVTRALASSLIGATLWMAKTLLLKIFAASFLIKRFFDRIQDIIFQQYVIVTLSGPPFMDYADRTGSFKQQRRVADGDAIGMKKQIISAWTMGMLIRIVTDSKWKTFVYMVDDESDGQKEKVISSAEEAERAACIIFRNVAKPGSRYIDDEDLSRFMMIDEVDLMLVMFEGAAATRKITQSSLIDWMLGRGEKYWSRYQFLPLVAQSGRGRVSTKKNQRYIDDEDLARFMKTEEVDRTLLMFEGAAATRKIASSSLINWMISVYNGRKYLAHSLSDTSTGIRELNKVVSGIVFVLIVIVWLLLMGLATTKVLVFISSQLLLVVFVFGNTCTKAFEGIIFIFVMHPFDVGDRCLIDGVQLAVEEINIMATIFLREDNEKIYYPNSVLATKTISNFNRSPDMNDSVEFAIDVSTSDESIAALEADMKAYANSILLYLRSKPEHWCPSFNMRMKGLEDNNMKMVLSVTHTMNFQDYRARICRRSELAFRLKKTCEELGIKCHLIVRLTEGMEGREAVEETSGTSDVVVLIPAGAEEGSENFKQGGDSQGLETFEPEKRMQALTSPSSLEIEKLDPAENKVLDRSVTRRRSLARSGTYLKPASRLVEPPFVSSSPKADDPPNMASYSPTGRVNASNAPRDSASTAPSTPLMASPRRSKVSDEEEVILHKEGKLRVKMKGMMLVLERIAFVCLMGFLIASLVFDRLKNRMIWSLEIWKWCVLVVLSLCGRLITGWLTCVLAFLVKRKRLPYMNILFFAYSTSARIFIWLGLVLAAWGLLIYRGVDRPKETTRILNYVTRALASSLIGATMWMAKTLLLKSLAASFPIKRFFGRIQEIVFQQYVIETLSGLPVMEYYGTPGIFKLPEKLAGGKAIDVARLVKTKEENISAWTMGMLIRVVTSSKWTTFSYTLDESDGPAEKEITSAEEAVRVAHTIFWNVAKPGCRILGAQGAEVVKNELESLDKSPQEVMETLQPDSRDVNAYNRRIYLLHSLNDTRTGITELNRVVSWVVFILIVIVWLLLMGLATTKVLVFISSQLVLLVFVFGNTCTKVFEGIIFVFVMHPFDVGDRCLIDGVQLVVEEINIMATIFLREDNEKIYYPNSVLATKTISNFNRSPDMSDYLEFAIDVSTSDESIAALEADIEAYLSNKPEHWCPSFNLRMKGLEDNNMKMVLSVTHTMNFQDYRERTSRRSNLACRLKKAFEELSIKCYRYSRLQRVGKEWMKMLNNNEVVVMISNAEESSKSGKQSEASISSETPDSVSYSFSNYLKVEPPIAQIPELRKRMSSTVEITRLSPSKVPEESPGRRRSFARSANSKSKSRLVEPSYHSSWKLDDDNTQTVELSSPYVKSPNIASPSSKVSASTPKDNASTAPITPKTPLMASLRMGGEDANEVYKAGVVQLDEKEGKKISVVIWIEWIAFVCILGFLICSLLIERLRDCKIWSLEIWKWCALVLVIFCGRLVTGWLTSILVFLLERNFLLKEKVLYFVFSLKTSFRVFIWLGLILLAWVLLIDRGVKRSKETIKVLNYITRGIASSLIGAALWMVKTLLVKVLAASFHVKRFFDRIQENIFHQYILQTLSGPPFLKRKDKSGSSRSTGQLNLKRVNKEKQVEKEESIDVGKLHKMKREKVSAWTIGGLVKVIRSSGLSTITGALDERSDDEQSEPKEKKITNEPEAEAAAHRTFKNVAKPGYEYIDEEDLLQFLNMEEVDNVLEMFAGEVEKGKIKKASFCNWVINIYNERKYLALSLNDTKTAIEELNRVVSTIVFVLIIIVWLLLMGIATTQVLLVVSSQLLLLVFMFGNTCKTAFEAMVFVFIMHPFDIGDRCVIDGVQMLVEEMNILTTIFLRYDNEMIYYPNSVLATKPISNFNRSPEMGDAVEFSVDVSTTAESIEALKARIKGYLESKPQLWQPAFSLRIKEIEDLNKMKMGLGLSHTMNFQNFGEKSDRRSDLLFELKKIFEDLGIKYHLLPQEVHIRYLDSAAPKTISR
ncbi:hypothetical protein RJ640_012994, partial [Escallonia rubra]